MTSPDHIEERIAKENPYHREILKAEGWSYNADENNWTKPLGQSFARMTENYRVGHKMTWQKGVEFTLKDKDIERGLALLRKEQYEAQVQREAETKEAGHTFDVT